jgi:hypothetical protein
MRQSPVEGIPEAARRATEGSGEHPKAFDGIFLY